MCGKRFIRIKKFLPAAICALMAMNMFGFVDSFKMAAEQKPEIKVFLLAGQSNMCGAGNIFNLPPDLLFPETEVLAYYDGQIAYPQYARMMKKLNGHLGIGFGPELTFGLDMENYFPSDKIALIKWAYGATSLYDDWNPSKTDNCYSKFKDTVISQIAELSKTYTPVIRGMLWMQGESDALNASQAEAYETNLRSFISTVKTEFSCPDLKFVIGRISDSTAWTYRDTVRKAQAKIADETANTKMIDTDDLSRWDLFHYDNDGLYTLGHRYAVAMNELITGIISSSSSSSVSRASSVSSSSSVSRITPISSSASSVSSLSLKSSQITSSVSTEKSLSVSALQPSEDSSSLQQSSLPDDSDPSTVNTDKSEDSLASYVSEAGSRQPQGKIDGTVIGVILTIIALSAGGVIYFIKKRK